MYINKLMINQFEDKGSAKKPNLVCVKHLVDDDGMNVKKLADIVCNEKYIFLITLNVHFQIWGVSILIFYFCQKL